MNTIAEMNAEINELHREVSRLQSELERRDQMLRRIRNTVTDAIDELEETS